MPEGQQPQETAAAADGGMVRACDRCGTICSADQEWCLACGVRMSPVSSRLPGLRAAGVVVSLAVLLAGGAAAASYAALRSDTSTTAAAPAGPAGTPVTPSPTPPPVTPAEDPAALPPVDEELPPIEGPDTDVPDDLDAPAADPDLGPDFSADVPSDPVVPDTSGDVPPDTGGDATDATDAGDAPDTDTGSGGGGTGDKGGKGDKTSTEDQTGPIELASGQGSLYDPEGIVEDRGDESRAIDGNVKTSWRATLGEGKTGEFGYVLDFDAATALKALTLHSPTKGLKVKILGTTRATLPETTTDAKWVELAPLTTLKGGAGGSADFKLDGAKKLRHVLVLIAETPGTPAVSQVNEIQISR